MSQPQPSVNIQVTHTPQTLVVRIPKNVDISLLLTFLLGPIGLLYASVAGFFTLVLLNILVVLVSMAT